MLVSKPKLEADDIITLKLSNGDEIVGKLIENGTDEFLIYKPCTVIPSAQGIGLMQTLISADINKNVPISKASVMMSAPTMDEMRNHYIRTTTGIEPVTRGSIIT